MDKPNPAKPTHYKVICLSIYNRDHDLLEAQVAELKRRGMTKISKSQLVRIALSQLDLDKAMTAPEHTVFTREQQDLLDVRGLSS